jgi:hypothetical protein
MIRIGFLDAAAGVKSPHQSGSESGSESGSNCLKIFLPQMSLIGAEFFTTDFTDDTDRVLDAAAGVKPPHQSGAESRHQPTLSPSAPIREIRG